MQRAIARSPTSDLEWLGELPSPHQWPLDAATLRFLAALLVELQPQRILEFGSGLSTRVMARGCATLQPRGQITTLENDPFFARRVREAVEHDVGTGVLSLESTPLVARRCRRGLVPAYLLRRDAWEEGVCADLVLIDGPSAALGGRAGTIFQALEFSREGTLILLDDADRAAEAALLESWSEDLDGMIETSVLKALPNLALIRVTAEPRRDGWWWLADPTASRGFPRDVPGGGLA